MAVSARGSNRCWIRFSQRGIHGARSARRLRRGESIDGFGHPLYRDGDPRAAALIEMLRERHAKSRELAIVLEIADAATSLTREQPNLDFALAAVARSSRLPAGSPLTLSRLAGRRLDRSRHRAVRDRTTDSPARKICGRRASGVEAGLQTRLGANSVRGPLFVSQFARARSRPSSRRLSHNHRREVRFSSIPLHKAQRNQFDAREARCRSQPARNLGSTRSSARSAPGGWARCIAPKTRACLATPPSRSRPRNSVSGSRARRR